MGSKLTSATKRCWKWTHLTEKPCEYSDEWIQRGVHICMHAEILSWITKVSLYCLLERHEPELVCCAIWRKLMASFERDVLLTFSLSLCCSVSYSPDSQLVHAFNLHLSSGRLSILHNCRQQPDLLLYLYLDWLVTWNLKGFQADLCLLFIMWKMQYCHLQNLLAVYISSFSNMALLPL